MTLTREALRDLGYEVPPEGGLAVRVGNSSAIPNGSPDKPAKREPLQQSIIDAMVAAFPLPTQDQRLCPRVIACDPSVNEAGFAQVGGPHGIVRVAEFRSRKEWGTGEKVLALARFATDFVAHGLPPDMVIVEGTYLTRGKAPSTIITLGKAVGACLGALCRFDVCEVEPDWMPRFLTGRTKDGGLKEDRHRVARGLLARAGWQVPEGGSPHTWDACCMAVAKLSSEGWL